MGGPDQRVENTDARRYIPTSGNFFFQNVRYTGLDSTEETLVVESRLVIPARKINQGTEKAVWV
jgi:hypothetical protein